MKWLSNQTGHTATLRISEKSVYISQAILIWHTSEKECIIHLMADYHIKRIRSVSSSIADQDDRYIHILNVADFVRAHLNARYKVQLDRKSSNYTLMPWHMLIVYGSPFMPLCHISMCWSQPSMAEWDTWISSLPINSPGLPWSAKLQVLDPILKERTCLLNLQFNEDSHLKTTNYSRMRSHCPSPVLIAQVIRLPVAVMEVSHCADRYIIKVGDIVTIQSCITNIGKLTASPVQYRTTLPRGTELVSDSFKLNNVPIPIHADHFNAVTVYLRAMPERDEIVAMYQIRIKQQIKPFLLSSATLDFSFRPAEGLKAVDNLPSNTIRLEFLDN
ncbi:hypothetical protein ACX1C1_00930 [Paenibacillus sp. strain BS8-2]